MLVLALLVDVRVIPFVVLVVLAGFVVVFRVVVVLVDLVGVVVELLVVGAVFLTVLAVDVVPFVVVILVVYLAMHLLTVSAHPSKSSSMVKTCSFASIILSW